MVMTRDGLNRVCHQLVMVISTLGIEINLGAASKGFVIIILVYIFWRDYACSSTAAHADRHAADMEGKVAFRTRELCMELCGKNQYLLEGFSRQHFRTLRPD